MTGSDDDTEELRAQPRRNTRVFRIPVTFWVRANAARTIRELGHLLWMITFSHSHLGMGMFFFVLFIGVLVSFELVEFVVPGQFTWSGPMKSRDMWVFYISVLPWIAILWLSSPWRKSS